MLYPVACTGVTALAVALSTLGCGSSQRGAEADSEDPATRALGEGERAGEPEEQSAPEPHEPPDRADPPDPLETAEDEARIVEAHNHYRDAHCAAPLSWSDELAELAADWAEELAERDCVLEHSGGDYGENLAGGTLGALDPETVVELWYEEIELYDFADPEFSPEVGHFTQVVWAGSRELGCARATCSDTDLWVCQYAPAGNTLEEFEDNVLPTSCAE